jgi:MATE family multidrug resistance protein
MAAISPHRIGLESSGPPAPHHECVKQLAKIAIPAVLGQFLTLLAQTTSTLFVGNYLGPDALAAQALGIRLMGITGVKIGAGCACALDTLCSQEHGRNKHSTKHGEYVQRSFVVHAGLVAICTVQYVTSPLYIPRIFPPPIGVLAAQYLQYGALYIAPLLLTSSLTKMLQAQGLAWMPMQGAMIGAVSCVCFNWYFIRYGMPGASIALGATAVVQFASIWIMMRRHAEASYRFGDWRPISVLLTRAGMKEYLKLGIPSSIFVVVETAPFTTMVIYAGLLGGVEASSYTVAYSIINLLFTTSYGMSGAAAARIGNALGEGLPATARRLAFVAVAMTASIAVCNVMFLLAFHRTLYRFFTDDQDVLNRTSQLCLLSAVAHIFDCLQFVFQGIFTACGKNHWGFPILMVALLGVAIPLAGVLAFGMRLGAWGLFAGLATGLFTAIPIYSFVVLRFFDWELLAGEAAEKKQQHSATAPVADPSAGAELEPGDEGSPTALIPIMGVVELQQIGSPHRVTQPAGKSIRHETGLLTTGSSEQLPRIYDALEDEVPR